MPRFSPNSNGKDASASISINVFSLIAGVPGEIVALIGHNGAGKSTLLKAIFGMISIWQGQVYLNGVVKLKATSHEIFHSGVAFVP